MSILIYKALAEFEHEGSMVRIGQELALGSRDAENLAKRKLVTVSSRELDLNDENDALLHSQAVERKNKRHDAIVENEGDRDKKKEKEEKIAAEKKAAEDAKKEEEKNDSTAIQGSDTGLENKIPVRVVK